MARDQFIVRLTLSARDDIGAIHDYLLEHRSEEVADAFLQTVLDKVATLERFPMRGSIPLELEELGVTEFRQLLLRPYRLFYRIEERTVFVMAIADGRRNMQSFLETRLLSR